MWSVHLYRVTLVCNAYNLICIREREEKDGRRWNHREHLVLLIAILNSIKWSLNVLLFPGQSPPAAVSSALHHRRWMRRGCCYIVSGRDISSFDKDECCLFSRSSSGTLTVLFVSQFDLLILACSFSAGKRECCSPWCWFCSWDCRVCSINVRALRCLCI